MVKAKWAETIADRSDKTVTYIATAIVDPQDEEWQQRILRINNAVLLIGIIEKRSTIYRSRSSKLQTVIVY